ncbi:hypothetical protein LCGC14_2512960 [marine sediment metagenome]|uniref:DUF4365 domain-containing protein n=1 Tax=marine sediment metagenome TaxID=412755 RepID=A0A0F9BLJ7_9ZZZZ
MEKQPTWVKVAQNGAIGEARTKSFLLDRFWILERSIDIHGADFIIQRRLTNRNILDRNAPKLGVVQAKFIESSSTSHYIHSEYVIDKQGLPRDEFFLIVHTGNEENPLMCFFTSKEIKENFDIVNQNEDKKFYIPGKIIKSDKFKVKSRRETLDKIETQLIEADFTKNREYLNWALISPEISYDDILPEFNIPIDNYWGDIPEGFYETKINAAKALTDVETVYFILQNNTTEKDPIKASEYLDDFSYYCQGGARWYISLPDNIYDEEFIETVKKHKEIVQKLKDLQMLDEYIKSHKEIENSFKDFLCTPPRSRIFFCHPHLRFAPPSSLGAGCPGCGVPGAASGQKHALRHHKCQQYSPPNRWGYADSQLGRLHTRQCNTGLYLTPARPQGQQQPSPRHGQPGDTCYLFL